MPQKMIWVPKGIEDEIKQEAGKQGKSFSQYLIDLHRGRFQEVTINKPVIKIAEKERDRKEIIYTESYRKKNPMETCAVCGKALRFNCGH